MDEERGGINGLKKEAEEEARARKKGEDKREKGAEEAEEEKVGARSETS